MEGGSCIGAKPMAKTGPLPPSRIEDIFLLQNVAITCAAVAEHRSTFKTTSRHSRNLLTLRLARLQNAIKIVVSKSAGLLGRDNPFAYINSFIINETGNVETHGMPSDNARNARVARLRRKHNVYATGQVCKLVSEEVNKIK